MAAPSSDQRAPAIVDRALAGSGRELESRERAFMEPRFGHDFGSVRIHTDAQAAEAAEAVHARAFTLGPDIVFGPGQYRPQTAVGRQLLAHELAHSIQQGAAPSRDRDWAGSDGIHEMPRSEVVPRIQPIIQRAMKFELQTFNPIWRTLGENNTGPEKLPRKFGPSDFLHKAARGGDSKRKAAGKEGKGMELQSETGGFAEFETPTWSRKLLGLKKSLKTTGILQTMQEGVDMTTAMNSASPAASGRKQFPFDVSHLRKTSGSFRDHLRPGEELEVEIVDPAWHGQIQSSESLDLTQYESLLREHEVPSVVTTTINKADGLVQEASTAESIPLARLTRLRSFLQILVNYINRGQRVDLKGEPSKAGFLLMSRTSFSSMYREILEPEEQKAFQNLVRSNKILSALGLGPTDLFFKSGHGSAEDNIGVTVDRFLQSIYASRLKNKRDYLSPPREDKKLRPSEKEDLRIAGSAAMGRFDVETAKGLKDTGLVKFEARATMRTFTKSSIVPVDRKDVFPGRTGKFNVRVQPAKNWVSYAFDLFTTAGTDRQRADVEDDPTTPQSEERKTRLKI